MAEFVNREELIERMEGFCLANCGCRHSEDVLCSSCRMNDAIIIAEDFAADVIEHKTGKWLNLSKNTEVCGEKMYRCEVCGEDFWMTPYSAEHLFKYCHNCGAKMEGVDD